jgi:hypothetical protein
MALNNFNLRARLAMCTMLSCFRSGPFLALVFLLVLAFALRVPMVVSRPLVGAYQNEDAASHLMLTGRIMASRPFGDHHLLPIFTLSREVRRIDNLPSSGVIVPEGDFIYTSFPPLSFVLVAMVGEVSMDFLTPVGVRILAVLIGLVAALGVYLVSREMARSLGAGGSREVGFLCAVSYLMAPECLHSFCVSLWAHQFYECFILFFLYACQRRHYFVALVLLYFACLTEWSSYLAAGGAFLFFAGCAWRKRSAESLLLVFLFGLVPVLALGTMLAWFGSKVPIPEYLAALTNRAGVRSFQFMEFLRLLAYALGSVGGVAFVVLMGWRSLRWRHVNWNALPAAVSLPLVVIGFSLAENFILAEHAKTYSFDRLKLVSFLCLVLAFFMSRGVTMFGRGRVFDVAVACFSSLLVYLVWRSPLRDWGHEMYAYSKNLGARIASGRLRSPESLPVYDGLVRADLVYYAGGNVVERYSEKAIAAGVSPFDNFILRGGRNVRVSHYRFQKVGGDYVVVFPSGDAGPERSPNLRVPENRHFRWKWFLAADMLDAGGLDLLAPDRGIGMSEKQISDGVMAWRREGFAVPVSGQ